MTETQGSENWPTRTRTWPYGTRKAATVLSMRHEDGFDVVLCYADDSPSEAHVIINLFDQELVEGDRGEMVFLQGGPTGGYWTFEKKSA
jgi:hypothetical protein